MITLKALTNQEAGKKIMYVDACDGAICKMNDENELNFYRVCRQCPNRSPLLQIIPEVIREFRLRDGVDRFDLSALGVGEAEILAMHDDMR